MCARKTSTAAKKKQILVSDEFYSDMSADGMIFAMIFRSPFPYGKIISVGLSADENFPDGYDFFTYKDIPGCKKIKTFDTEFPVFCDGNIRYKGEPIGILTGPDKKLLKELVEKIKITLDRSSISQKQEAFSNKYAKLTVSPYTGRPLSDSEMPKDEDSSKIKSSKKGLFSTKEISTGDVSKVFNDTEKTKFIIDGDWESGIQNKPNRETNGAFCFSKNGFLHVYAPNQWITHLRKSLSEVLGLEDEKIITTRTKIQGENGNSIWKNSLISVQTALAALKTGKPVMMILSRDEQKNFITNAPQMSFHYKTALDDTGMLLAMEIHIEIDIGIYNPFAQEILERIMIASTGVYKTKNLKIKGKIFCSNNPPTALNFSTIDSRAFFALENQIQKISEKTGFSPLELRLKNQNTKGLSSKNNDMPFFHELKYTKQVLEAVCKKSDFNRKSAVYRLSEKTRFEDSGKFAAPRRGIGLACAFEGCGFFGTTFKIKNTNVQITLTEDKKLVVNTIPPSNSIKEIWTKIITEELGLEKKNIVFEISDTDKKEKNSRYTTPETLLGSISIKTDLLKKCVAAIKKQKDDKLPLTVKKSLSNAKMKQWNNATFSGIPFFNTSFAACTVETELDECTYRENILKICVVVDGGKILHVKAAENVIKTSIQKTLALLMEEEVLKCPEISVQFVQSEEEPKQIGHIVASILPPAFTAALSQALTDTVTSLPLKTDSLFKIYEPEA